MVHDQATKYGKGYGLLSGEGGKGDLDAAVVHWCQWMEWNNKGPVRLMRFDHGSEVIRHGEITAKFQVIAAKYHFTIVTSAPDDQATNPQEREYQTVSRRMVHLFLQQDNLTKDKWLLVLFAAITIGNCVCHGESDRTPSELMTGVVPDATQLGKFFCGQTVMWPRTTRKVGPMQPGFEWGVFILPILANKASLVLPPGS